MKKLSIYKNAFDTKSADIIDVDILISNIRDGQYQDAILKLRNEPDKEKQKSIKKSLPVITISGTFSEKTDKSILSHSGLVCIDIDELEDPEKVKEALLGDPYVLFAFVSCRGYGLAVVFKIKPERHRDSFSAIADYLYKTYGIVSDSSAINESRGRFVSFDPHMIHNPKAKLFSKFLPKKEKRATKIAKTIYVKSDFDRLIKEIQERGLDIAGSYDRWCHIGFALASQFGSAGREYWSIISEYRHGAQAANEKLINDQYSQCLKSNHSKSGITIATFYHYCKESGLAIYSQETTQIIQNTASKLRVSGMTKETIIKDLIEREEFDEDKIREIVPQVEKSTRVADLSLVDELKMEIRNSYEIRKNVISRKFELKKGNEWISLEDQHLNDIFLDIKSFYEKSSFDLITRIINSSLTPQFNPLLDFIVQNIDINKKGKIESLASCIIGEYGLLGDDRYYFMRKWFIGIISAMHGEHSPLMMVLSGKKKNTGKTEFFRRLLPKSLRSYYAESKLDAGTDDEILMTQKLIIMDDEMGGKSKREASRLKELTSKQTFSLREPYGRSNVDLNRLAVLCATSNEDDLLRDPAGNRRIIPINVVDIDRDKYNSIDKTALFMEAYHAWKAGESWQMSNEDIERLAGHTDKFEAVSMEEELLFKYFRIPSSGNDLGKAAFQTSEIKAHIEKLSQQRLQINKLGQILNKHLQKINFKNDSGKRCKGYYLVRKSQDDQDRALQDDSDDGFRKPPAGFNSGSDKMHFPIPDDHDDDLPW